VVREIKAYIACIFRAGRGLLCGRITFSSCWPYGGLCYVIYGIMYPWMDFSGLYGLAEYFGIL